jgi:hypothetical protein
MYPHIAEKFVNPLLRNMQSVFKTSSQQPETNDYSVVPWCLHGNFLKIKKESGDFSSPYIFTALTFLNFSFFLTMPAFRSALSVFVER